MNGGSSSSSAAQFIVVLLIFVGVLLVTFFVTKWMSGYQKSRQNGTNIEMIESAPLTANKHIQIVRLGRKYVALAVSKDTVTMLSELDPEEVVIAEKGETPSFKDILSKVKSDEK